jgi:hypothetical protein
MARIRSMKPELRTDLDVASWPIPARYAWTLLWGYLDDSGRGFDDDRLLVADLFPLDRDVTERKFAGWKRLWVDGGQVCRYTTDGTNYLHAINWDNHQRINRPTPSRIPPCPEHGPSKYDSLSDSLNGSVNGSRNGSVSPHRTLSEGSPPRAQARVPAEQGAGSREQGGESSYAGSVNPPPTQPSPAPHDDDPTQNLLDEHLAASGPLSAGTRKQLERHVRDSLQRAEPDQVRDALSRYQQRAASGQRTLPGLLPRLLDDVLTGAAAAVEQDPADDPDIAAWLHEQQTAQNGARR